MNIIGFAATGHDDSICLIEDGEIKNHFQLERYTRFKKNNQKFFSKKNPKSNITKKTFNIFDYIINKKINKNYIIATSLCGADSTKLNYFHKKNIVFNTNKEIFTKFNDYVMLSENVYYIDHHVAHAAYAYYTSDFKESDILAYDGGGKNFQSIFIDSLENIIDVGVTSEINPDFWIGVLWRVFSEHYFGAFTNSYGKMMGYSAYGKLNEFLLEKLESLDNIYSRIKSNDEYNHLQDSKGIINLDDVLIEIIFSDSIFEPRDAFATLQYFSKELVLKNLKKYRTSDNLCISGGCALNGYINEEILRRKIYKKIHVPPAASDESQSIGTALHALYNLYGKRIKVDNPNKLMYLGEGYDINSITSHSVLNDDELLKLIAKKISEGYVVGWYQERGESGPRALGNRSILADPRNEKMQDHINFKIKNREWYRPFAPSILKEYVDDWFETNGDSNAPYMTRILEYKKNKGKEVPATCHIDNTARVQTVTKKINSKFYNLIYEFYNLTNVPILLNTSFNGSNEPMVETPQNAFDTFSKCNIDILVTGNYVYFRNNDKNVKPFIEES